MTAHEVYAAFAATGEPPAVADPAALRALAGQHVIVLDPTGTRIRMAHPFAAHRDGARVDAGGRTWWGNCAWDGLGIAAALDLPDANVTSNGVTLELRDGELVDATPVFHVAVPARQWWEDIAFT
jgi:Alkylmercury lyase